MICIVKETYFLLQEGFSDNQEKKGFYQNESPTIMNYRKREKSLFKAIFNISEMSYRSKILASCKGIFLS